MKKTSTLTLLEELCCKLSIIVKYDKFFGKGGYCRLRDKSYFIINERLSTDAKEQIFIKEMSTFDVQNLSLPSKLKELFEKKCS
ncbi:hypothetical protein AMJ83_04605 [candidate division WOR_3 bacterium SM23_42]|uniref:Uncharacterized protein n=1 Tax=candidate division WOR_3 bacterium SM23_42 TaxID=1703779 RepID=A0A0S8FTC4_UNCW3|nr:MAG: hypothetical protein AMJ83_04605 [candidate division WOR_3 bacterium SM23_42]